MPDGEKTPRWSRYRPGAGAGEGSGEGDSGPIAAVAPAPDRVRRGAAPRTGMPPVGRLILVIVLIGCAALVAAVIWNATGLGGTDPEDAPQTEAGFEEFVAAIDEQNGGTEVYEVSVYAEFAYAEVPVDGGDRRSITYQWLGGDLNEWTKDSGVEEPLFDMADLDPAVFDTVCAAARDLVEDPGDCSLTIREPTEGDGWITAHVGNDFSEYGYVTADLDGTVIDSRAPGE